MNSWLKSSISDYKLETNVLIFFTSRTFSVIIKPLFLWYLLNGSHKNLADTFSIYFLCLGSFMIVLNNEAHFSFYKNVFGGQSSAYIQVRAEIDYYNYFVKHFLLFIPILLVLVFIVSANLILSLLILIMICIEKLYDEIQRMLIFKKEFTRWSLLMISKTLPPFLVAFFAIQNSLEFYAFELFFLSTLIVFIILFIAYIDKYQTKWISKIATSLRPVSFISYLNIYRKRMVFNQLQSFLSRNIPQLDRLIVRFMLPASLAEMTLVSQLGSISILFIDLFLISTKRRKYLELENRIWNIARISHLFLFLLLSYALYSVIVISGDYFEVIALESFTRSQVLWIGVYFALFSISQHFSNYNFWRIKRKITLFLDFLFFAFVGILILFPLYSDKLTKLVFVLACAHVFRLTIQVFVAQTSKQGLAV